ncbi:MAG: OmpA family protein [Methylomicrobium sp.]
MEYFIVRKAITAISVTMLGASIVIFLTALTISRHRAHSLSKEVNQTETDQPSKAPNKLVQKPPPEQKQSLDVTNKLELAVTPPEDAVGQNADANKKPVDSSAKQSLPSASAATPLQVYEKPPELVDPKVAEEKSPATQGPIRLLVLGEGSFSPGMARPEAKAQEAIDKIIPLIQARPLDKVIVEGHADKSIPEGFNLIQASKWNKIVSMLRAKAVAQVLRQKGVPATRIVVRGLGDAVPLASNLTKKGRSKNRRVEIKLSGDRH